MIKDSAKLSERAFTAVRISSRLRKERAALESNASLAQAITAVKDWQSSRLAKTHADLLESNRYRPAARFFLDDLYGSQDLSARDSEIIRMLPSLVKLLPEAALRTVVEALEMDALSEQLDRELAETLLSLVSASKSHFLLHQINSYEFEQVYRRAYLDMPNSHLRTEQLAMVSKIGSSLNKLVSQPLLGGLLNAMAGPAKLAGLQNVYDFLWRGFSAFKQMKGADEFLRLIVSREKAQDNYLRSLGD